MEGYRFIRPRCIYLITLHYAVTDRLDTYDINVLTFTNKRKAKIYVNACNRKAKAKRTDNRYEYYTMEVIRTI